MSIRPWLAGAFAALAAVTAPSAISPLMPLSLRAAATPGTAALRAYGSRGPAQGQSEGSERLDGALADILRHQSLVHAGTELADLHSLHPAARFRASTAGTPEVLVDAVTLGDPQALKSALVALGLEHPAVFSNDVSGWLPVAQLEAAGARAELHGIRAAMPRHRAAVATQGDYAQRSDVIRSTYPSLNGAGVTVGVLSDSFNCFAVYAEAGSNVPETGPTGYAFPGFTPTTAAQDETSGALPASVNVVEEVEGGGTGGCGPNSYGAPYLTPFTDEGRAMLQIVHAVAPGASLAFYTADNGEAEFANGIKLLQQAGATVEADDAGYYDEPFFQDGIVAQAINAVQALGVAYFSAAGNDAEFAYENTAPSFTTMSQDDPNLGDPNPGEILLNFDTTNATNINGLPVAIPALQPGEFIGVVVQWDQPYVTGAPNSGGATSRIDLCVKGVSGNDLLVANPQPNAPVAFPTAVTCTGANALGADPVQVLIIGNSDQNATASAPETINVVVGLENGLAAAPGRIKVAVLGDGVAGLAITSFATHSPTIQGHPNATGAAAVGAAFYFSTPRCDGMSTATLEAFSSVGGDPILFDVNGVRLSTPQTPRQKPDFVGPDGVNDTFLGGSLTDYGLTASTSTTECQTNATYPSFFGTSAATPHAAGIAALMLQSNSTVTPSQIIAAMQTTALPMTGNPFDYKSGYGFIQGDAALAAIPPGPPTLSFSSSSVTTGTSVTLTWSSTNTSACAASGSWSGSQAVSGTLTVTPQAAGSYTYTLSCSNSNGAAQSSSTLTVTAPASSGGHGGGALDLTTLLALAAALGWRWRLGLSAAAYRSPRPDR